MFNLFRNAWKIPELRKKILFTLLIIFIFRIGAAIPLPFVDISGDMLQTGDTFMNLLNTMTGGGFQYGTLFAMSVTPYINASIIMQLLTVAIPALERMQKEGEDGRKKIASITRYVTVGLGLMQSIGYYFYLRNSTSSVDGSSYLLYKDGGFSAWFSAIVIVLTLTAGTSLMMWLGEQINESGIGNGISILLFAGIVSRGRTAVLYMYDRLMQGGINYVLVPIIIVVFVIVIGFIVWMDNAERRIPIQYAKRVVGRKMYGGQSSHIPIKVNMSGVLPIIFASSFLSLPGMIEMFLNQDNLSSGWKTFFSYFQPNNWLYAVVYFILILFFAYFYSSIQYNPLEMANNLRKNSGAIPGIRPGKPTADYISQIMSRIVLLGALCLSVIALLPIIMSMIGGDSFAGLSIGGTSLLILVGVALETVRQIESQMMMRHYKGFLE